MIQFSLRAYSSARDLINSIGVLSPSVVLAIRPVEYLLDQKAEDMNESAAYTRKVHE